MRFTAIWAASSIEADMATRTIRSLWSDKEKDTFIESALETLEKFCDKDEILEAHSIAGLQFLSVTTLHILKFLEVHNVQLNHSCKR